MHVCACMCAWWVDGADACMPTDLRWACRLRQAASSRPGLLSLTWRPTSYPPACFTAAGFRTAAGPLLQRAVSVVFEGVPTHPSPSRCWEVVDKYQVGVVDRGEL